MFFSASDRTTGLWRFDSQDGKFLSASWQWPDVTSSGWITAVTGFESQGWQWLIIASSATNTIQKSQLAVFRRDLVACENEVDCNATWNVTQHIIASGYISATQVI